MKTEPLTIEEVAGPQDGVSTLRLNGPLLITNLFEFQNKVRANTSNHLTIDFTEVPYIDSAGIGALMGAYVSRQKDSGRSMVLVGVNSRVRAALQVTRVDQFFKFEESPAA